LCSIIALKKRAEVVKYSGRRHDEALTIEIRIRVIWYFVRDMTGERTRFPGDQRRGCKIPGFQIFEKSIQAAIGHAADIQCRRPDPPEIST
jgi:hypothetical protein